MSYVLRHPYCGHFATYHSEKGAWYCPKCREWLTQKQIEQRQANEKDQALSDLTKKLKLPPLKDGWN